MRIPGLSRRWLWAGAISVGVVLAASIAVFAVYPRVGAWMIRTKVGAKLASKLGREVRFGEIEVALGRAVLRDVEVRGPLDGDTPLVHIGRVDVAFDGWRSLVGKVEVGEVKLDGVLVTLHRAADGQDNVRDLVERLRGSGGDGAAGGGASAGLRPASITVTRGKLQANDEATGATALVADAEARWTPAGLTAQARGVSATTLAAPRASAAKIDVEKRAGETPVVTVEGGELSLWPRLALSGIGGKVVANPRRAGEYEIDLAGGYGGVPGRLWTARGGLDPVALVASVDVEAAKFRLDRLAAILEHSAVVDYAETSLDTKLRLDIDRAGARFAGSFHLSGLNVGHPMIAEKEVHGLDLSGQIAGSFEREGRKLELTRGDFVARGLAFSLTGVVAAPPRPVISERGPALAGAPDTATAVAAVTTAGATTAAPAGAAAMTAAGPTAPPGPPAGAVTAAITPAAASTRGTRRAGRTARDRRAAADRADLAMELHAEPTDKQPAAPPRSGPHGLQVLKLRLVIPRAECQRVLDAIPPEMAPFMTGYKVRGTFDADVHAEIDWSDLDATQLGGHVAYKGCKVVGEPDSSPSRLEHEFVHHVEVDRDEWREFDVGPSNDDFVPIDQISPFLVKSVTTTEDGAFFNHHGFIPSEFRTALVNNLKAGRFRQGASSITMQMVKNVLLYRDKTLTRKLQELFLTWHVENTLSKDRILEIYFNVIEYGPGLYGIGPAAYHYFGKAPRDLTPMEAAFFSTILPSPKERYKQYCTGEPTKWTTGKIDRILKLMLTREKLTQEEYDGAVATPLLFARDGLESEADCMKRTKEAIKNARPTNPLAEQNKADARDAKQDRGKPDRTKPDARDRRDRKPRHHIRDRLPI